MQAGERLVRIEHSLALLSGVLGFSQSGTSSETELVPEQSPPSAFTLVRVTNGILIELTDGSTNFYGSCSLVAQCFETQQIFAAAGNHKVLRNAVDFVSETLDNAAQKSYSVIEGLYDKLITYRAAEKQHNAASFDLPSRDLLDQSLAIYFSRSNHQQLALQERSFRNLVGACYDQSRKPHCLAAVVCFLHMIIQALELQGDQNTRSSALPTHQQSVWAENHEIFQKATQDVVDSPSGLRPQLLDVQALTAAVSSSSLLTDICLMLTMSKSLAALDDGDSDRFQTALAEACKLAKCTGLHQEVPTSAEPADLEERSRVFWNLYILDKSNLLATGRLCHLSSFDCGAPFPQAINHSADLSYQMFLARIRLANIQEEIYQDLYSVEACRRDTQGRSKSYRRLQERLHVWRSDHNILLSHSETERCPDADNVTLRAELSFAYHSSSVLVHSRGSDPYAYQRMLEHSRKCLSIVTELPQTSGAVSKRTTLDR